MLEEVSTPVTKSLPNRFGILSKGLSWLYVLAVLPAIALLYLILRFTPNVPFWDEYELVSIITKLHTGGFTFYEFWRQHNEHRIITQKLLELGLAALGGWDAIKEVLLSFFFTLWICAAGFKLLKLTVDKHLRAPLTLAGSLLIFSTIQYENQVWGMDMAWYLIIFCILISLMAVTLLWPGTKKAFFLALALTIIATYSSSLGLPLWVCVLLGMLALRKTWRVPYMVAWIGMAVLIIGTYFISYTFLSSPKTLDYLLRHLIDYVAYFLTYIATPWITGPFAPVVALFGFAALILSIVYNWRLAFSKRVPDLAKKPEIWRATLPWSLIILFVLANAAVTTWGRIDMGVGQAEASRYTTISIWFWMSTLVISTLALQQIWQRHSAAKSKIAGASAVLCVIFLTLYSVNYIGGYTNMVKWHKNLDQAIPFFYDYSTAPPYVLGRAYPDPNLTRQFLWSLDQVNESIFRPEKENEVKAFQTSRLQLYNTPAKNLFPYSPEQMYMMVGDKSSVTRTGGSFSFSHSGHDLVNIYVKGQDNPKQRETSSKTRILYIQTQEVWYAHVYWDTGHDLNENEKDLLYPMKDGKGNVVLAIPVPSNMQNFRVDMYYSTGREFNATLKIDMFEGN